MVAVGVNILLMNEDNSRTAYEALQYLIKKICQLLCPTLRTQHLVFAPSPEELVGYAIGKSFTASVDAALSCKPLLEALAQLSTSAAP